MGDLYDGSDVFALTSDDILTGVTVALHAGTNSAASGFSLLCKFALAKTKNRY